MGFFGDIISDARLPVAPVSRSVHADIESPKASVFGDKSEVRTESVSVPAASHDSMQESPVSLQESPQKPMQNSAKQRFESSADEESLSPGLEQQHPVSPPLLVHADGSEFAEPDMDSPISRPENMSVTREQDTVVSQHSIRHPVAAETETPMHKVAIPVDFEDFSRLADTFDPNTPKATEISKTAAETADETTDETTPAVIEKMQMIQTPDTTMRIRSRSRTEHVGPEHAAPETGHADPVTATVQQADQWLGGRLAKPVAGPKKEESHQQSGVKIGRIDVVIEAPAQSSPVHVEPQQTTSHGFSSRHYLRGV